MRVPGQIAFLLEDLRPPSPGQQLLDRFLIGYPKDGAFRRPPSRSVTAYLMMSGNDPDFERRPEEFQLQVATTAERAVEEADAVVVVPRRAGAIANERLIQIALERAPTGASCFVHGALANSLERSREFLRLARSRQIALLAGTPLAVTWRLPEEPLRRGTSLREALIVVQGPFPEAEAQALDGLLPILEHRRGGETGVRALRYFEGAAVWRAGAQGLWSRDLLAAALSRSDSPQGNAVADGRTEDLVGLGLVPKLARAPRGWLLEHADGLRTTLLVLDGVVADFNFAVQSTTGAVMSAQLFRAPPPAEHHFSRLAAVVEDFFFAGRLPWTVERSILIAGLLEVMATPASRMRAQSLGNTLTLPFP